MLVPVLMYETMFWKEKERSRIRAVQMDSFLGLMGIRKMDRVPISRIKKLCGVKKGLNERIYEGVSWGSAIWRGWRVIGLLRESM